MLRVIVATAVAVGLLAYPVIVYFSLDALHSEFSMSLLVLGFGVLCCLRLLMVKTLPARQRIAACMAIALFCLLAWMDDDLGTLKFYPVLINLGLAGFFTFTLFNPPSAIERFSARLGMQIEGRAVGYTRTLTMVWLVAFICNALAAAYTALYAGLEVWTFYNGFLSYVLIGLLLAIEYPVRLLFKKRHSV